MNTDTNTLLGRLCQPGHYCEQGFGALNDDGTDCAAGSYSDAYGLTAGSQCHQCSEGKICASTAMLYADMVDCTAGYYCLAETDNSAVNPVECGIGK
jgi:hypothetical protein